MTNPAEKPSGRPKKGSIRDISRKLYRALEAAEKLLESPDPATRLKAVHATSQAAWNLARVTEITQLERRMAALEGTLEEEHDSDT